MQNDNPEAQQPPIDDSAMVEDFADCVQARVGPWSAAIDFGLQGQKRGDPGRFHRRMRMPLPVYKALALLMVRQMRTYEAAAGHEVMLPEVLLRELKIAPEDWRRMPG